MIWGWFRKSGLPRGVYRPNIFEGPHLVQRWSYHSCSEIIWPSVPVQLQQRFMIEIQQNNALAAALKKKSTARPRSESGLLGPFPIEKTGSSSKALDTITMRSKVMDDCPVTGWFPKNLLVYMVYILLINVSIISTSTYRYKLYKHM